MAELQPTTETSEQSFSYVGLEEPVAQRARAIAKKWHQQTRDLIFELGNDLLKIKPDLGHGSFRPYVEQEIGISMRSAQLAMNAAEKLGSKSEIVSHLPVTTIHLLSAPSTPADVRDEILEQLATGERPSPAEIKNKVKLAKSESKTIDGPRPETHDPVMADSNLLSSAMTVIESPNSTTAAEEIVEMLLSNASRNLSEAVRLLNLCTNQEIIAAIDRYRTSVAA
ncbi:hypothetical protein [Methylobacterium haplocladii]|uniref:hypothetical protein n=1 Tax=Methylobacterium haplocladii TaxID=1176176 RepID=UPI001EDE5914|nr:hypothetical protein [Methylobacterium haplocladii]GJD82367.1 hypothetical protein HPGCJGGD_0219 [Methylobacterium haplocladii]